VNDAFAVSHRQHASIVSVPRLLAERAAGFLIQREIQYFQQAIDSPARPLTGIIGGAKVSSKLHILGNMLAHVDRLIIGGAMANTFLKAKGLNMGASLIEADLLETAGALLDRAEQQGIKVYLPVDSVTAKELSEISPTKTLAVKDIGDDWMALDIGPASSRVFSEALENAKTIILERPHREPLNSPPSAMAPLPLPERSAAARHFLLSEAVIPASRYKKQVRQIIYPISPPAVAPSCIFSAAKSCPDYPYCGALEQSPHRY